MKAVRQPPLPVAAAIGTQPASRLSELNFWTRRESRGHSREIRWPFRLQLRWPQGHDPRNLAAGEPRPAAMPGKTAPKNKPTGSKQIACAPEAAGGMPF